MRTSPLRSGDQLPNHPDGTTALRVIEYGRVHDDTDGHELMAGLHRAEVAMLMSGQTGGLDHLYRYAVVNGRIFHTRGLARIDVECTNAEADAS